MTNFRELVFDDARKTCEIQGFRHPQRLYEPESEGVATKRIKIGKNSRWPRHESHAIVAARIAGATDEELRKLVKDLHEQRKVLRPALPWTAR